jgi:hypothetical protein
MRRAHRLAVRCSPIGVRDQACGRRCATAGKAVFSIGVGTVLADERADVLVSGFAVVGRLLAGGTLSEVDCGSERSFSALRSG